MSKKTKPNTIQYLCIHDGQQERMYFEHLAKLLRNNGHAITFTYKLNKGNIPRKISAIKYEKVFVFDHDGEMGKFKKTLEICIEFGYTNAYSNRNFDLWLLLHKKHFANAVSSNDDYMPHVRKAFDLSKTDDIKKGEIVTRILEKISLDDIKTALHNANRIRDGKLKSDTNKVGAICFYSNPDLSIHSFIKNIFKECGEPTENTYREN
ncbi:MAG: RloB family protein [Defluviitaleaceae bacterium]|nr:RloB family protein [Defluviitaleaceae bacterium]